jgi:cellulose synthase/poly-beta-1,6-N-acetylglucosamine synthase-like glycosyltransferase
MSGIGWALLSMPVILGLYAYAGYPAILWLIARRRKVPATGSLSVLPGVTVIVPAYNEETQIGGAIDALLKQDYPPDRLHVMVLSDASTDGTDSIVRGYASRGVELLRMEQRGGKTKAENHSAAFVQTEMVVNTDASIRLHPAAIRELMVAMSVPDVGVASGRDVSISHVGELANLTEAGYVNYEMRVRSLETRTGGIVGASGSCYAIRTVLHQLPVRDDLSRDFSAALIAQETGFRAVSVDSAICFVPRTSSLAREYHRKIRTISRGVDTLLFHRALLNPRRHGLFAWKLISHKLCRWLFPLSMIPGIAGLVLLSGRHVWAQAALGGLALTGVLAGLGALWPRNRPMPRLVSVVAFGVSANLAVLVALVRVLNGGRDYIWEPTRRNVAT